MSGASMREWNITEAEFLQREVKFYSKAFALNTEFVCGISTSTNYNSRGVGAWLCHVPVPLVFVTAGYP